MTLLRAMTPDDYGPVAALLRRNGLAAAPAADWRELLVSNPFRDPDADMGWVLEDDAGVVVGTFGNLRLGYEWNRRPLRTAAAYAWAVDPAYRDDSIRLLRRYMRQLRTDVLLTSTASARVGEIFTAVRFEPVPHPDYDQALFWVTNASGFVGAALRQKGIPLAALLRYPAGFLLSTLDRGFRRTSPPAPARGGWGVHRLDAFDARFDDFWERLRSTPDRLLAVRSAAVLSWHFARLARRGQLAILALESDTGLDGYLVMFRHDHEAIGLTRYRVADLQVLGDVATGTWMLLQAALAQAAEEGVHALEVIGLSTEKRAALRRLVPRRRQLPSRLFYYRPLDKALAAPLGDPNAWDPSPYDGDASL